MSKKDKGNSCLLVTIGVLIGVVLLILICNQSIIQGYGWGMDWGSFTWKSFVTPSQYGLPPKEQAVWTGPPTPTPPWWQFWWDFWRN